MSKTQNLLIGKLIRSEYTDVLGVVLNYIPHSENYLIYWINADVRFAYGYLHEIMVQDYRNNLLQCLENNLDTKSDKR